MAVSYKLVRKNSEPAKKEEGLKKWYAVPKSSTAQTGKQMTKAATENTTVAPIEMEAALELLAKYVPKQIAQGHTVHIPGVGYLRLSFKSQGVEKIEDFNPAVMIRDAKLVFKPDEALRSAVLENLTFEDGGVLADGVDYASRKAYLLVANGEGGASGEDDRPGEL